MAHVEQQSAEERAQAKLEERLELIESLKELARELNDNLETGSTAESLEDVNHAIKEAKRLALAIVNLHKAE